MQTSEPNVLRVALYKAKHGGVIDWLINWFTGREGYSHTEIIFPDGVFFSSSGEDGGVRFKLIPVNRLYWTVYRVSLTPEAVHAVRAFCRNQDGKKYDWCGVLGFVTPTHHAQGRWFCSEIVVAAMQHAGLFKNIKPWKVNPNVLRFMLDTAASDDFQCDDVQREFLSCVPSLQQ